MLPMLLEMGVERKVCVRSSMGRGKRDAGGGREDGADDFPFSQDIHLRLNWPRKNWEWRNRIEALAELRNEGQLRLLLHLLSTSSKRKLELTRLFFFSFGTAMEVTSA